MSCPNCQCELCRAESRSAAADWLARQDIPKDVHPEEVLFYKYQRHPSISGLALWSPETRKWCGFWPDGTPLTGYDEETGREVRWWWATKLEVLSVIHASLATQSS